MKTFMTYRQLGEAIANMNDEFLDHAVAIVLADGKNEKGEWNTGEVVNAEGLQIENHFVSCPAIVIDNKVI